MLIFLHQSSYMMLVHMSMEEEEVVIWFSHIGAWKKLWSDCYILLIKQLDIFIVIQFS